MKKFWLTGLALLSAATAANSATVTNGTFDDSTAAQPTYTNNAGVNLNLTSSYGATPDGVNSGYINSSWNILTGASTGAITFQLAGLVIGQQYLISFLDASPSNLAANAVTVAYNSTSLGSFTPVSASWTSNTTSAFTATGATGSLSFTGSTVAAYGATRGIGIDGVSISAATAAVPEPASWAMMVAGFGLLGATLRRRKPDNAAVTFG